MIPYNIAKAITLGHSQHGKSTIAGSLFLAVAKEIYDRRKYNSVEELVIENVKKCSEHYQYGENLRYALIFDGLRQDVYNVGKSQFKTITTKPYTLKIRKKERLIEITDLPGHQSFMQRISGALEINDIGIFVVDSKATIDSIKHDDSLDEIYKLIFLKKDPKEAPIKGRAPESYLLMLKKRSEEAIKKKKDRAVRKKKTGQEQKKFRDRMHPPILYGIFNYLILAWHLGIRHFIFAIHKMDLVDYSEDVFDEIVDFIEMLKYTLGSVSEVNKSVFKYIPTAVTFNKDVEDDITHNIKSKSAETPWFEDKTLTETFLEAVDQKSIANEHALRNEKFRFLIDNYNHKWNQDLSDSKQFYKPWIHGMAISGKLKKDEKINLCIKDEKDEFLGPIRCTFGKDKKQNELNANVSSRLYLNVKDLKEIWHRKVSKNVFFYGNFAFKENEKKHKPIIVSNFITIEFKFVGGWLYQSDFNARIIYGHCRSEAKIMIKRQNLKSGDRCLADVRLDMAIPFIKYDNALTHGKVVIEKNTYIIGIGSLLRM